MIRRIFPAPSFREAGNGQAVDFSMHVSGASTVQTHVIAAHSSQSFSYGCARVGVPHQQRISRLTLPCRPAELLPLKRATALGLLAIHALRSGLTLGTGAPHLPQYFVRKPSTAALTSWKWLSSTQCPPSSRHSSIVGRSRLYACAASTEMYWSLSPQSTSVGVFATRK